LVTTIPKAQSTGNFKVEAFAHVTQIVSDSDGRVSGVLYLKDGTMYFQPASVVLLGCYTYENVRILLLSRSRAYPNGLSNNHGQVGRHFFNHSMGRDVAALFPFDLNAWYGAPAQCASVDDWADDNFDHSGLGFIGGANISVNMELTPLRAADMATFGLAPSWGAEWKTFIKKNANRWISTFIQRSTFPYEDQFLDLDPTVIDPFGAPVCRITLQPVKENEKRSMLFSQDKAEQWLREAGATHVSKRPLPDGVGVSQHAYGGTRMGDDPDTNVVDRWGFSHEVSNLGVLGASVMGTSGARNPTLTIQALAWRAADHLIKNWKSKT
jgi:gluconate 2-dehydrogenase alpha chain